MKILKTTKPKVKLLNLNLLKTDDKGYKEKHLNNALLKDVELKFKNALNIVFKFHAANKKILFIGTSITLNRQLKTLFKNTNHSFIPEKVWLNGVLTNTKSIFKFLFNKYFKKNKNNLKFLFNLTNKNNLVVIINEYSNSNILKEISKKRIPAIALNYNIVNLNQCSSAYKIKQNLNGRVNKSINNTFYSILTAVLKKAEKIRIKKIKNNLKQKHKNKIKKFYKKNVLFKKK